MAPRQPGYSCRRPACNGLYKRIAEHNPPLSKATQVIALIDPEPGRPGPRAGLPRFQPWLTLDGEYAHELAKRRGLGFSRQ